METDRRIYVTDARWTPAVKQDDERMLCFLADEDEGYYHRIAATEVYLDSGTEVYCFNCAFKKGILSTERPKLKERESPEE